MKTKTTFKKVFLSICHLWSLVTDNSKNKVKIVFLVYILQKIFLQKYNTPLSNWAEKSPGNV